MMAGGVAGPGRNVVARQRPDVAMLGAGVDNSRLSDHEDEEKRQ